MAWRQRWAVDYVNYEEKQTPFIVESNAFKHYKNKRYKYLVTVNEEAPSPGSITRLILKMENTAPRLSEYTEQGLTIRRLR